MASAAGGQTLRGDLLVGTWWTNRKSEGRGQKQMYQYRAEGTKRPQVRNFWEGHVDGNGGFG